MDMRMDCVCMVRKNDQICAQSYDCSNLLSIVCYLFLAMVWSHGNVAGIEAKPHLAVKVRKIFHFIP